jgi:hypothetical protein
LWAGEIFLHKKQTRFFFWEEVLPKINDQGKRHWSVENFLFRSLSFSLCLYFFVSLNFVSFFLCFLCFLSIFANQSITHETKFLKPIRVKNLPQETKKWDWNFENFKMSYLKNMYSFTMNCIFLHIFKVFANFF